MFELLGDVEQSWWYRGRAHTLQSLISRHVSVPITDALDYGAGNGGMAQPLRSLSERVFAFEPDGLGHRVAAGRGYTRLFTKEAEALSQSYDLIMLADVLEHIEDDGEALVRLKTVLKPSGLLAITVPAYEWLWSVHDELNYHHRRYTRALLVNRLREAGFEVVKSSYWNMSLLVPAATLRLIGKSGEGGLKLPEPLNSLLYLVIKAEAVAMRALPLPFGLSVVAVARPARHS